MFRALGNPDRAAVWTAAAVLTLGLAPSAAECSGSKRTSSVLQVAQAAATEPSREALERELDELFQRMLANPGDLDVTLRYAQVSVQLGDFETAVMAYERLLMIDPNLPRIRYELGFLYYRLGSLDLARTYLQRALAAGDMPADVRSGAQALLAEIGQQTKTSSFAGSLTLGFRYQTNANSGPAAGVSRSAGQDITLGSESARQGDWNAFGNLGLRHRYDLDTANDASIDSDLSVYGARQIVRDNLDLFNSELRSGPRLRPFEFDPDLQVRPHLLAGWSTLEDRPYSWQGGIGLDVARRITEEFVVDATTDYRRQRYYNHGDNQTRIEQTGWEAGGVLRGRYTLSNAELAGFEIGLRSADTRRRHNDFFDISGGLSYTLAFDGPFSLIELPWSATFALNHAWTNYYAPDQVIDPDVKRKDRTWKGLVTISVPVSETLTAYVQATAARYNSTLPNYEYDNLSIVFGLTHGF